MQFYSINTHHAFLNNEIVIKNLSEQPIFVLDKTTGVEYKIDKELRTHLSAGTHILMLNCNGSILQETVVIEDAIKLGGSKVKKAFVFDNTEWAFVETNDRLYIYNRKTGEERVEYNLTPEDIVFCGRTYFLFKTEDDVTIYDISSGKFLKSIRGYIKHNDHLILYEENSLYTIYDFSRDCIIDEFDGQYSRGNKFYYIKSNKLYGLNTRTNYKNFVLEFDSQKPYLLKGNCLMLVEDESGRNNYCSLYELGNGENCAVLDPQNGPVKKICFYSGNFLFNSFGGSNINVSRDLNKELAQFKKALDSQKITSNHVNSVIPYLDIISFTRSYLIYKLGYLGIEAEEAFYRVEFNGECELSYKKAIPFIMESDDTSHKDVSTFTCPENEGRLLGHSKSNNIYITQKEGHLYEHINGHQNEILTQTFDDSSYKSAFFTSDGQNVVFSNDNTTLKYLHLENFSELSFDITGSTVPVNEGYNGYLPEFENFEDGRNPIWRDPVTMRRISRNDLSCRIFRSPNNDLYAKTQHKVLLYNRLTEEYISIEDYSELCKRYNYYSNQSNSDKEVVKQRRKELAVRYGLKLLKANTKDFINAFFPNLTESQFNDKLHTILETAISFDEQFTTNFIERKGFVCVVFDDTQEECLVYIGDDVWYLNYVSFSYDSRYMAIGAKLREQGNFGQTQKGVFIIYDLSYEREVIRLDENDIHAVWMTSFSKDGKVAFYDSHANAYLLYGENFETREKADGKSLLCFSSSGKYIALSDQNYVSVLYHPESSGGHQPSTYVYIHSVNQFDRPLATYNDLGAGIAGASSASRKAKSIASAAFSSDDKRLLIVGEDGVIVIRNLHLPSVNN